MTDIKKISSEDLLQELINRKVLTKIPAGLYKEFELKRKYRDRDKPIHYDSVFLLNSFQKKKLEELTKWYRSATSLHEQKLLLKLIRFYQSN